MKKLFIIASLALSFVACESKEAKPEETTPVNTEATVTSTVTPEATTTTTATSTTEVKAEGTKTTENTK